MANLRNIRINPKTGEKEYFFPMEVTQETLSSYRGAIKQNNYEVGYAKLGYREFLAIFIPCSETEYRAFIKDELDSQEAAKQAERCLIGNDHGKLKRCPMRVPNPAYKEGSAEPKTLAVKCEDCPHFKNWNNKPSGAILFSMLENENDDGETTVFKPKSPANYSLGNSYETLVNEWVEFVKSRKPKLAELAGLLAQEYVQADAAKELNKSTSTIHSQNEGLKALCLEFLDGIISL